MRPYSHNFLLAIPHDKAKEIATTSSDLYLRTLCYFISLKDVFGCKAQSYRARRNTDTPYLSYRKTNSHDAEGS